MEINLKEKLRDSDGKKIFKDVEEFFQNKNETELIIIFGIEEYDKKLIDDFLTNILNKLKNQNRGQNQKNKHIVIKNASEKDIKFIQFIQAKFKMSE